MKTVFALSPPAGSPACSLRRTRARPPGQSRSPPRSRTSPVCTISTSRSGRGSPTTAASKSGSRASHEWVEFDGTQTCWLAHGRVRQRGRERHADPRERIPRRHPSRVRPEDRRVGDLVARRAQSLRQPRASGQRPLLRTASAPSTPTTRSAGSPSGSASSGPTITPTSAALGAGLLPRRRKDVGDQLDHRFPEGAVRIARSPSRVRPGARPAGRLLLSAEPPVLEPGSPGVDASAIPEYTNLFEVVEVQADGTERLVGTWDDRVEIVKRDGRSVLRRIQNSKTATGTSAHLDEVDQKTLQPLRARYAANGTVVSDSTWEGRRLTTRDITTPAGSAGRRSAARLADGRVPQTRLRLAPLGCAPVVISARRRLRSRVPRAHDVGRRSPAAPPVRVPGRRARDRRPRRTGTGRVLRRACRRRDALDVLDLDDAPARARPEAEDRGPRRSRPGGGNRRRAGRIS